MAFLLKSSVASHFRQTAKNDSLSLTRRQYHVEPGAREKALLAADPSLRRFKSHKQGVLAIKRLRKVLTVAVVAGFCYEIYVKVMMPEEARAQA